MLTVAKVDSRFLFKVSKLLLVVGVLFAVLGLAVINFHASPFLALEVLGALVIFGGIYLRRKARTFQRRFEWRDGHVPA